MQSESRAVGNSHRRRSSLESLFCYDKAIPEERIETPVGLSLAEKAIGDHPKCNDCHAKGAILCATCSGCGLYVDSILESQGIIVKVRCLGRHTFFFNLSSIGLPVEFQLHLHTASHMELFLWHEFSPSIWSSSSCRLWWIWEHDVPRVWWSRPCRR